MPNFNLGIDAEADADRQRLCCLCDVVQSGRRRVRRHQRAIWRAGASAERQSQPDLRAREEQGDRNRHQMGAVRPALAGDRRRCSRPRRKTRANRKTSTASRPRTAIPGCSYNLPARSGNVSCITAGAAYRIRGIDLGVGGKITDKWSVFGGLVLMQSEVTKSLVPSPQPLLFPTNVGLKLANVAHQSFSLLSKYQLTDVWEIGGQAVYRSEMFGGTFLAANQGTSIPSYLALRYLRRGEDRQELDGETVRRQHHQQALLRCALSERDAVRVRRAGPQREHGDLGTVLDKFQGCRWHADLHP